jgi:glycosyltransferase involved in cell wall biosynthesis
VKFSIVTVTFNSACYIDECMKSVLGQDYRDLEYILVDGGSTDGTLETIRRHAACDDRIRWISEPDEGISDAFNKGIRLATGEMIGIINSDDRYAAGALRAVAETFSVHPACDVFHGDILRFEGESPLFRLKPAPVDARIWHEMPLNHPATFVTKRAYARVGLFDARLKFAMDYDLVLRLYLAGCRFCYLDRVLADMRYGGVSDARHIAARREVYAVTVQAGYPRWKASAWFLYRVGMTSVKNLLRRLGLLGLIRLHPRFRGEKS